MKRGDVKHGRVIANKSDTNKTFKSLCDEFISNAKIRGLSEWIIKTYQYQINYFTEFAGDQFQMPYVKGQETFKEIYSEEEIKTLLEAPSKKDFITSRTHTIIWVLTSTGIRARELRELKNSNEG